jgi:hypothetical protein
VHRKKFHHGTKRCFIKIAAFYAHFCAGGMTAPAWHEAEFFQSDAELNSFSILFTGTQFGL